MRILIITHPRSGGKSLLNWISKEKGYYGNHEPNINNKDILNEVISKDDVVVKLFPKNLTDENIDIEEFANTFDKVICHHRVNVKDVTISMVYGSLRDNKNHDNWHKTYDITPEWLIDNEDKINTELILVNEMVESITSLNINSLKTTYEGIYESKHDIDKLIKYLEIDRPFYTDILDNRHRLRGGDIGENDYKINKPLI